MVPLLRPKRALRNTPMESKGKKGRSSKGMHEVSHSNTNMSSIKKAKKVKTTVSMKTREKVSRKNGPNMQQRVTRRPE